MTTVAIVYHSATGRTRALAEAVARGASSIDGATVHLVSVEEAAGAQGVLARADAIVFGCPTYMGSTSAAFKAFMDGTSAIWALQGWRDKLAAGFTHSAAPSGDKLGTLVQLAVFAAQHGMNWIGLGLPPTYATSEKPDEEMNRLGSHLGAMAQSRPGGGTLHPGDVRTAEHLGKRVAEAAARWQRQSDGASRSGEGAAQHPTARDWSFPPEGRPALEGGCERVNLREIVARPDRYEHHLLVCATVDGAQLEIVTASEPLYFAHINFSDELAMALPSGDELVDRFPFRTFLTDPESGEDVARYNHRVGDVVLHPQGLLHWPGRLRAPYEVFEFPPGMRRCGLSLVYCGSVPTTPVAMDERIAAGRETDAKAYAAPAPRMMITALGGEPGLVARIGRTSLTLIERPAAIAPPRGGFVLVLETSGGPHAPCDLVRIPEGARLDPTGIVRALVLASEAAAPDATPPLWRALPAPPIAPHEDGVRGALPFRWRGLSAEEAPNGRVTLSVQRDEASEPLRAEVPRHWLARMLFRVALHQIRLGYVETYGGFFVDDRGDLVELGVRTKERRESVGVRREDAMGVVESLYRAVAPVGYRERLE